MKVGSFLFGSPVSASAVTKPIFEIKSTEENDKVHSLKNERDQERLSLKECSIFHPLRKGRSLTVQLHNSIRRKTGMHLYPLKSIKNWRLN